MNIKTETIQFPTTTACSANIERTNRQTHPLPRISWWRRIQLWLAAKEAIHRKARAFAEEAADLREQLSERDLDIAILRAAIKEKDKRAMAIKCRNDELAKENANLRRSNSMLRRHRGMEVAK